MYGNSQISEYPIWVRGGGAEDAGRSSAAVSIPDHLLRRSEPPLSAASRH
jgi:hypothetical protein